MSIKINKQGEEELINMARKINKCGVKFYLNITKKS